MKTAKQLKLCRRSWHTVKGMYDYVDTLNGRRRNGFLMRVESRTGPIDTHSMIAMGYISKDGRWLSDPGERIHRAKEMAA